MHSIFTWPWIIIFILFAVGIHKSNQTLTASAALAGIAMLDIYSIVKGEYLVTLITSVLLAFFAVLGVIFGWEAIQKKRTPN